MSSTAQFASTPNNGAHAQVSVANTARDGTGTIADVFSPGASGSRIDDIALVATTTTTAGVIRLWIHNGTSWRLWKEILVSAITPSATVQVWSTYLQNLGLVLKTGWKLGASTHNAETFNVLVTRAGDL